MNPSTTESLFSPDAKACARCSHWSGARRPVASGSAVIVMAAAGEARRARCGVSSMARSASEACSRFQPAFS